VKHGNGVRGIFFANVMISCFLRNFSGFLFGKCFVGMCLDKRKEIVYGGVQWRILQEKHLFSRFVMPKM
jgi:hypothetical protein